MRHRVRVRTHLPSGDAVSSDRFGAALGVPCVFNVLGPLTNPASPSIWPLLRQSQDEPIMAAVYAANGQTGMVYTSSEGLDEMAPTGPVSIWEFKDGKVVENEFDPTVELGLAKINVSDLKGGEPELNARLARDFFAGKDVPFRTTALLNAASAIVADGHQVPADASLAERFKRLMPLPSRPSIPARQWRCSISGLRPPRLRKPESARI